MSMSVQNSAKLKVRAPEITGGLGWLNTDKPLSLAALKGKVVLLDFWTYGCINCIHIIPDLKKLEAKYPNELVVIGVHSAKFDNEKETENIRRIILRYELEHPVYNDADYKVWQSYGVRAWPTQVLIDPAGYVIGTVSGEGNGEILDQAIAKTIEEFRKRGELNEEPLKLTLERAKTAALPLAFPGKVLADATSNRLFIADSNHNRIVIAKLDGTMIDIIGTGTAGAKDGSFQEASFFRPQGMALDDKHLYVADTENHLIRRIDQSARTVETVAGTGKQSYEYFRKGPGRTIGLSSPWDLTVLGRVLYIAMAGPHQIWQLNLITLEVSTFAGSGREVRRDGLLAEAGFAQPSGITTDGKDLFIADSESNIIRRIDVRAGIVETLVGGDLFEFGDVDGLRDDVRLQHPLGIASQGNKILIADTYNHKIKELSPQERAVRTVFGNRKPGQSDGLSPTFYEPGGLSLAQNKLYVADTNNHAIRVIDLDSKRTTTLKLKGLMPPAAATDSATSSDDGPNKEEVKLPLQQIQFDKNAFIITDVTLPAGYHLNPAARQRLRLSIDSTADAIIATEGGADSKGKELSRSTKDLTFPLRIPLRGVALGKAEIRVQLTLFYCREDNTGTCHIKTLVWQIPVEVVDDANAGQQITLQRTIGIT